MSAFAAAFGVVTVIALNGWWLAFVANRRIDAIKKENR